MDYFKKILRFAKPYRKFGFLNVFFNILYALFSALSFAALIPMLNVLFEESEPVTKLPVYAGMSDIKDYFIDYLTFFILRERYAE